MYNTYLVVLNDPGRDRSRSSRGPTSIGAIVSETALAIRSPREAVEAREAGWLSPVATLSAGASRPESEPECDIRTAFQRDRDRILHTKSFRRLMHKTQVFVAPAGDHYRTRLTHTLEVTQIARTIGRALRLNEDLIEAIALGHDLGHTPFGHAGETALAAAFPGFRHNQQSLRIVDHLERQGRGLNLTDPVRDGILCHSKYGSGIAGEGGQRPATLEGEIVRISDAIAYLNHDLDDALRAELITAADLPPAIDQQLGSRHAARINTLVTDIIAQSETATPPGAIRISPALRQTADALRDILFARVYTPLNQEPETDRARHIVHTLFAHFAADPGQLPEEFRPPGSTDSPERQAADFVSSMTDRYAINLYERLFVPRHWSI